MRTRLLLMGDWIKRGIFGRDLSKVGSWICLVRCLTDRDCSFDLMITMHALDVAECSADTTLACNHLPIPSSDSSALAKAIPPWLFRLAFEEQWWGGVAPDVVI